MHSIITYSNAEEQLKILTRKPAFLLSSLRILSYSMYRIVSAIVHN